MALFYYYGRDAKGKPVTGNVEQSSRLEVANYLAKNNITPVKIEQRDTRGAHGFFSKILKTKISDEQLILFSRQIFTIYQTGLPLNKGLEGLLSSLDESALKLVLVDIVKKLKAGFSFSKVMSLHPGIFSHFFISMITIGEATGKPAQGFLQVGDYLERDLIIKKNIQSAVRYPCFVLFSILVALISINFLVVPAFNQLFDRLGTQLPVATQILLWMSNFFTRYSVLLVCIIFLIALAFKLYQKTPEGSSRIGRWYYQLPFLGPIFYKASLARYAHSLSTLLRANVPLHQAIALAGDIVNNDYLKQEILKIKAGIERGETIYSAHHKSRVFSPLVLQMVNLGEQTASLDVLLDDVAQSYEREIDYDIKRLSAAIEPLLILILALFVGLLALGVFLPMWSLFESTL